MTAPKAQRAVASDEEMKPRIDGQGSSIGPSFFDVLRCEHLDADLYRSSQALWRPSNTRGVFGGQVIGQAVGVSNRSVRDEVRLHSLHCYFLLAGDETIPIYYNVCRLRDGGSYVTRLVEAKQRGKCIFVLFTSYAKPEPFRPRFEIPLPAAINNVVRTGRHGSTSEEAQAASTSAASPTPPPSSLLSLPVLPASPSVPNGGSSIGPRFSEEPARTSRVQSLIPYEKAELNENRCIRILHDLGDALPVKVKDGLRRWILERTESPIEIRDALAGMYDDSGLPTPGYEQAFWLRAKAHVAGGEDAQKAALAYASDMNLLGTVPKALGITGKIQMAASLDHSMWFYEPFDMSQPLLFFMQTQVSSNGRGLATGRFYSQKGTLLAVVAQEGMVRARDDGPSSTTLNKVSKM